MNHSRSKVWYRDSCDIKLNFIVIFQPSATPYLTLFLPLRIRLRLNSINQAQHEFFQGLAITSNYTFHMSMHTSHCNCSFFLLQFAKWWGPTCQTQRQTGRCNTSFNDKLFQIPKCKHEKAGKGIRKTTKTDDKREAMGKKAGTQRTHKPFSHRHSAIVLQWRLTLTPSLYFQTGPSSTGITLLQCVILYCMPALRNQERRDSAHHYNGLCRFFSPCMFAPKQNSYDFS